MSISFREEFGQHVLVRTEEKTYGEEDSKKSRSGEAMVCSD